MLNIFARLFALLSIVLPAMAAAQDVRLTSRDGRLSVDGTFLSYDGEFYRIDSIFGQLTLDATGVTCSGPGCPTLGDFVAELTVVGDTDATARLLPHLLHRFAEIEGMSTRQIYLTEEAFHVELEDRITGQVRARFRFSAPMGTNPNTINWDQVDLLVANQASNVARSRVLAMDSLVPIVSPDNPLHALNVRTLQDILDLRTTTWLKLTGSETEIDLYLATKPEGVGQSIFPIAGDRYANLDTSVLANRTVGDTIARNPYALGLVRLSDVGSARILNLTGSCGAQLKPNRISLKTRDYPFVQPIYLNVTLRRLPQIARRFLRFLDSDLAQREIAQSGYVDRGIERIPFDRQAGRLSHAIQQANGAFPLNDLQTLVKDLSGLDRLTPTFRFRPGSSDLDDRSLDHIRRLVDLINAGAFDGQTLTLAGFSDGEGSSGSNMRISSDRAEVVKLALLAQIENANVISIKSVGYGEAFPISCDDSDWGRQVNRRVELWASPDYR